MEQEKLRELRTITFAMEETFKKEGYKFLNISYKAGPDDSTITAIIELSSAEDLTGFTIDPSFSSSANLVFYDEDGSFFSSIGKDFFLEETYLFEYFHVILNIEVSKIPPKCKSIRLYLAPSSFNIDRWESAKNH